MSGRQTVSFTDPRGSNRHNLAWGRGQGKTFLEASHWLRNSLARASVRLPCALSARSPAGREDSRAIGTTSYSPEIVAKAVALLRELVPRIARLAALVVPSNSGTPLAVQQAQLAAANFGLELTFSAWSERRTSIRPLQRSRGRVRIRSSSRASRCSSPIGRESWNS